MNVNECRLEGARVATPLLPCKRHPQPAADTHLVLVLQKLQQHGLADVLAALVLAQHKRHSLFLHSRGGREWGSNEPSAKGTGTWWGGSGWDTAGCWGRAMGKAAAITTAQLLLPDLPAWPCSLLQLPGVAAACPGCTAGSQRLLPPQTMSTCCAPRPGPRPRLSASCWPSLLLLLLPLVVPLCCCGPSWARHRRCNSFFCRTLPAAMQAHAQRGKSWCWAEKAAAPPTAPTTTLWALWCTQTHVAVCVNGYFLVGF